MIRRFVEIEVDSEGVRPSKNERTNRVLFTGGTINVGGGNTKTLSPLKIAEDPDIMKYQGQYPVIYVSFKDIDGSSYKEIEQMVITAIKKAYKQHKYLKHSKKLDKDEKQTFHNYLKGQSFNEAEVQYSLYQLCDLLHTHFGQKAYIMIDEYDAPMVNAYLSFGKNEDKKDEFENVLFLLDSMYGCSLKGNKHLARGLTTGTFGLQKRSMFSGFNNMSEYTLLDQDFSGFYGFTDQEVDDLLLRFGMESRKEEVKRWYGDYIAGNQAFYNSYSIMMFVSSGGVFKNYWTEKKGNRFAEYLLASDSMQAEIVDFLDKNRISSEVYYQLSFEDLRDSTDSCSSILLFNGYLKAMKGKDMFRSKRYNLKVPNIEVRNVYVKKATTWITTKLGTTIDEYDDFVSLLRTKQISVFKERLKNYLAASTKLSRIKQRKGLHPFDGWTSFIVGGRVSDMFDR